MNAPTAAPTSAPIDRRSTWVRRLLVGIVLVYVGVLILAPIVGLIAGALSEGPEAALATFRDPQVRSAFALTLRISLTVVVFHTVFGTAVAWMLVRDRFRGVRVLNGLIDLPFAVSPVVVGYMLLLLFGRQGPPAPVLQGVPLQGA